MIHSTEVFIFQDHTESGCHTNLMEKKKILKVSIKEMAKNGINKSKNRKLKTLLRIRFLQIILDFSFKTGLAIFICAWEEMMNK